MSEVNNTYTWGAKTLHWAVALLILGLLPIGFYMVSLEYSPFKLQLYGWHKSFGTLVLVFMVLRVFYRVLQRYPASLNTHQIWEKWLSHFVHVFLYVCAFAMPVSGWLMSSAGGFPYGFFGLFEMPALIGKDETLFKVMRGIHEITAWGLIILVCLHVAGALKHHVIDRDHTLRRMAGSPLVYVPALLVFVFSGSVIAYLSFQSYLSPSPSLQEDTIDTEAASPLATPEAQNYWQILPQQSSIRFEATQYGQAFEGVFEEFSGEIVFDVQDLENSHVFIQIPIENLKTGSEDRDVQALSDDWFAQTEFPNASFESRDFEKIDANRYVAKGDLTIRGVKLPFNLPFSIRFSDDGENRRAVVLSQVDLSRLDFGVGQGQWKDVQVIGNNIKISIHVEALKKSPSSSSVDLFDSKL